MGKLKVSNESCLRPDLSPCTASRKYKCRCQRCVDWLRDDYKHKNEQDYTKRANIEWRASHKEQRSAAWKRWRLKNPDKILAKQLRKFNLTIEQFRAFGDVCMICGHPPRGTKNEKRLFVDHDHVTGKVRGVVCNNCNLGLEHFKDSAILLASASTYLWRHHKNEDTTEDYVQRSVRRACEDRSKQNVELCEAVQDLAGPCN